MKSLKSRKLTGLAAAVLFAASFFIIYGATKTYGESYGNFVNNVNNYRQVGSQDAAVTIVIYTDFQCYWCRKFEERDLPYIMDRYVKTGKVLLQFRDFPLTLIHPYAFKAAEYADCAAAQGKYMPVRNLLYKLQSQWSQIGDLYYFLKTNGGGILNLKNVESCVKSGMAGKLIKSDRSSGMDAKVTGTPTLFIYQGLILYKQITGYRPLPVLKKTIEGALR